MAAARARSVMEQWDMKTISEMVDGYNDTLVRSKE
jgi:hypothetical protein